MSWVWVAVLSAAGSLFTVTSQAATYHVALDGNDGNPGTVALPWRTLQHAADTVIAGDRVIVHPGDYTDFNIITSGTAQAWIRFSALAACLRGFLQVPCQKNFCQ